MMKKNCDLWTLDKYVYVCYTKGIPPRQPRRGGEREEKMQIKDKWWVQEKMAHNPDTPPKVLARLVRDAASDWVSLRLAQNPSTPPEALAQLAGDRSEEVRIGVADNPNTPPEVLAQLAGDRELSVREAVAKNPSMPKPA